MHRMDHSKKQSFNQQGYEKRSFGENRTNQGYGQGKDRPQTSYGQQQAPFKKYNPNQRRFEGDYDKESNNDYSYRGQKKNYDDFSQTG